MGGGFTSSPAGGGGGGSSFSHPNKQLGQTSNIDGHGISFPCTPNNWAISTRECTIHKANLSSYSNTKVNSKIYKNEH